MKDSLARGLVALEGRTDSEAEGLRAEFRGAMAYEDVADAPGRVAELCAIADRLVRPEAAA